MKFSKCPDAAQKAFQERAAGGKIGTGEKAAAEKRTVYEAEIKTKDGKEIEVIVTPEGKLAATEYKLELLASPEAVQKTITGKSTGGGLEHVEKWVAAGCKVTYTTEIKPAKGDLMVMEVGEKCKFIKLEADKD